MSDYFSHKELLKTPAKRAAYSDRTSYVMSEMSRLAYHEFEEPGKKEELKQILAGIGFELINIYHHEEKDTQAFLCCGSDQNIAVLAFRGTETNMKDIETDATAILQKLEIRDKEVEMHEGYHTRFNAVMQDIVDDLDHEKLQNMQLFITGHSLGGALAIVATKYLANDSTGACYTFGSPPVGTQTFDYDIKTPIYRIVNHVDIVPRLPTPVLSLLLRPLVWLLNILFLIISFFWPAILKTKIYGILRAGLLDLHRYRQSGYGSFLVGERAQTRLRYNVAWSDKLLWWLKQFVLMLQGKFKMISDHANLTYSEKLAIWAKARNRKS